MSKYIVGNWKSNKTLEEAFEWLKVVGPATHTSENIIVLCPPFPFLYPLHQEIEKHSYNVKLGVQNISPYPAGSYTGEVTTRNLEELGVEFVILGHSERRKYFGETAQIVSNKVNLALEVGITPIVCVDKKQIVPQAFAIEKSQRERCLIAYEPMEYIGTGTSEPVEVAKEVLETVKKEFSRNMGVLYGGSVNPETDQDYTEDGLFQGVLVGTASLDAKKFIEMV
jgi:triosephosphate isomerase